jgi:SAM-dependent methyltransferase
MSSVSHISFEACPLCESRRMGLLRTADCAHHPMYHPILPAEMRWMRCEDCGHVFTEGHFTEAAMEAVFGRSLDIQKPGHDFERQRFISARIVDKATRYVDGGAWLDVGFGNGSLLFTAQEFGFEPVGIDLRETSVAAMKRIGVAAERIGLEAVEGAGRFSVISLADVLEHMPYPKDGLVAARRLLRPDGILFVSLPSYDSLAWRLLDAANANPYWYEIEHYHNFSRSRLYELLEEMGFTPLHYGVSERYRLGMEVIARPRP